MSKGYRGKCKEEIDKFIISNGWKSERTMYTEVFLSRDYLLTSKKGMERKLRERYFDYSKKGLKQRELEFDRYFLDYIGHILRKHKVKVIDMFTGRFESTDWQFDNIKRIPNRFGYI